MTDRPPSPDSTARMGGVMIVLTWLLLLGMLTYFFHGLLQRRLNPNSDPQVVVSAEGRSAVVLERNVQGHYVASGYINQFPVTFLLDTGATDIALSEALADKLALKRRSGGFSQTANGVVAVWATELDVVSLGSISRTSVRAVIMPGMDGSNEVLLGMSFLKHLEMVQKGNHLTLRQ